MDIRPSLLRLSACLGLLAWVGAGICEQAAARAGGAGGRSSSSKSSGSKSSGSSKPSSGGSSSRSSSGSTSRSSGGSSGSTSRSSGGSSSGGSSGSTSRSSGGSSSSGSTNRSSSGYQSNSGSTGSYSNPGSSSSGSSGGSSGGSYYDPSSRYSSPSYSSPSYGSGSSSPSPSYSSPSSGGSSSSTPSSNPLADFFLLLVGGGGVIGALVFGYCVWSSFSGSRRALSFVPDSGPELPAAPVLRASGIDEFFAANPDFDLAAFTAKVRSAFVKIQKAWTDQDLSRVRRFISDGMYQRFATQFRMMGLLKQRNVLDEIQVFDVQPVAFRRDGAYDVIDVWISASMSDSFECELDPSMNTEGNDPFVEYWSLIRKRGAGKPGFDLVADPDCPSCGAALPEAMGELCRCAHCQVMVNSGEFDWVLAEITQEADYGDGSRMAAHVYPELEDAIAAMAPECPDFSQQLAEDKASNAFMQIMTAHATRNPASVRRFVSDELFAGIAAQIPDRNIIFSRIYLNESVLLDVDRNDTKHRLAVGLSASLQRVELLPAGDLAPLDGDEQRLDFVLTLERDIDAVPEKGSLYQHQCANCGGAVGDTLDVNCQYCGSALNSTRNEWIVCGFEAN